MVFSFNYKSFDLWSDPLWRYPRWYKANSYPTLTDYVPYPLPVTWTTTGSIVSATGSVVPLSWGNLNVYNIPSTGSIIQSIFYSFTQEKELIRDAAKIYTGKRFLLPDPSEEVWGWVCSYTDNVNKLEVLYDNGWQELSESDGEETLIYSYKPTFFQTANTILITKLNIVETPTYVGSNNFSYITYTNGWEVGNLVYYFHNGGWVPITSDDITEDGRLPFLAYNPSVIRCCITPLLSGLQTISIRINGSILTTATLANLSSAYDTLGIIQQDNRFPIESNSDYGDRLVIDSWFGNQTIKGLSSFVANSLGLGSIQTITPANSSSFNLGSFDGFTSNKPNQGFINESGLVQYQNLNLYLTNVVLPDYYTPFLNNLNVPLTPNASGFSFSVNFPGANTNTLVNWAVTYYDIQGNNLVLTPNYKALDSEVFYVYTWSDLDLTPPDLNSQLLSFRNNSAINNWQSTIVTNTDVNGLSVFV